MSVKITIKNSIIDLCGKERENPVVEELRNFNIADKTPLDCMDFLRNLLNRYGKKKIS